jgi:hypothetical protein
VEEFGWGTLPTVRARMERAAIDAVLAVLAFRSRFGSKILDAAGVFPLIGVAENEVYTLDGSASVVDVLAIEL